MKPHFYIDLASSFGDVQSAVPSNIQRPVFSFLHTPFYYRQQADNYCLSQTIIGTYSYLYSHTFSIADTVSITLQVSKRHFHILYLLASPTDISLHTEHGQAIGTLSEMQGAFYYLPKGKYQLNLSRGRYQFFGFETAPKLFQLFNERSYAFLEPLLISYQHSYTEPICGPGFSVDPHHQQRLHYLCQQAKTGSLECELRLLEQLRSMIELAKESLSEYRARQENLAKLAEKARELITQYVLLEGQAFALAQLEKDLNRSLHYLNTVFKKRYQMSLREFKVQKVLELAIRSLDEGIGIKNTGYRCGFESPSTFCHFFKRQMGISAREYLQQKNPVTITRFKLPR